MFFTFSTKIRNPPTKPVVPTPVRQVMKPLFISNKYKCSSCGK